jgi:hypothetical protein
MFKQKLNSEEFIQLIKILTVHVIPDLQENVTKGTNSRVEKYFTVTDVIYNPQQIIL